MLRQIVVATGFLYKQYHIMTSGNDEFGYSWKNIKAYGQLLVENMRLASTEKLTILLSSTALAGIIGLILMIAFFFISAALVLLLARIMPFMWSFLLMGGIYILLGLMVLVFRKKLLIDPIARFLSRLFLEAPTQNPTITTSTELTETEKK